MISMNYENSCVYLCFCCADAVDCGAGRVSCMVMSWVGVPRPVDSRLRGNDGPGDLQDWEDAGASFGWTYMDGYG